MPTYSIQGPDGKTYSVEGPAGATRSQVIAEIERQNGGRIGTKKASTSEDVAKSGATGFGKGIRNALGTVFSGSPQGMVSNALGSLGATEGVRKVAEVASPLGMLRNAENVLGLASGTTRKAVEKAPSRDYVPQTRTGRYAESVGENAANALAPGGIPARVASVVVPGVTGEGAREAASALGAGEKGQAAAKLVGTLAGGLASSVRIAPRSQAGKAPVAMAGQRAKLDPALMRAKAAEMRAAGVDPTLVDVAGPKGRRVIRAVGVKNEVAGEALTNRAREVSSTAKPEIMARTREVGPMRGTTAEKLEVRITEARDKAAKTNYAKPYDTVVQVPDTVLDMLHDSSGRAIIGRARADAIENQDWGRQVELDKLLALPDDGGVGPLPQISAGTIDRLVIAARERGGKFMERGNRMRARGAFERQKQLDAVLSKVDELKPARADYHAKSQAIDVLGKGRQDVFSTDPGDYGRWLESLPPEAREANKVAIRQEVLDTLGGQRSATFGSVDELATSQYAQANLRQALGPEADRYLAFLRAKLDQVRNARFVDSEAGSRTAVVGEDMQKLGSVLREGAGAIAEAKTGNLPMLMARGANWLASRGFSDEQAKAITRMAIDPRQTDEAIRIIEQRLGPDAARTAVEWRRAALVAGTASATALQGQQ